MGVDDRTYPVAIVPHADHGDVECCGCLFPVIRGNVADLVCNECGAVVRTVPAAEAEQTLLQMAMTGGVCSETCPHCTALNAFTGFSAMEAYICCECGLGVRVVCPVQ